MLLNNTFETGSNGTAITALNSGGAGNDAFDSIAGTLAVYSSAAPHAGALGATTSGTGTQQFGWAAALGAPATLFGRIYIRQSGAGNGVRYIQGNGGVTTNLFRLSINAANKASINLNGGTAVISTAVINTASYTRLEWMMQTNGVTATFTVKIFNTPESTTPDDTITQTGAFTDTTVVGCLIGQGSVPTNTAQWDDFTVNDSGYPGPVSAGGATAVLRTLMGVGV